MGREFKLETRNVIKALNVVDGNKFDNGNIYDEWLWARKVAISRPNVFRESKTFIMHGIRPDDEWLSINEQIYDRMFRWKTSFGRDSMTFNTLIRSVSIAQYSMTQVRNKRLRNKSVPPAFDPIRRASSSDSRKILRAKLEDFVRNSNNKWLKEIKYYFSIQIERYQNMANRTCEILTNGTTTGIEWQGFNITDIMGVIFIPEGWETKWTSLSRFLKLENDYNTCRDTYYIKMGHNDKCESYGGEHMIIPDKDGKEREVYRFYSWIQIFSKSVHKFLDGIVKNLEGNYSYKHREWLRNIVSHNWNADKFIIGTDMSKYSDTLDRSFIMFLLTEFGLPKRVVKDIDELYSQDIWDSLLHIGYKGTQATFQGQYGDFPMITLCNLVIQAFIYDSLNMVAHRGYRAAVGDDTGMIFDKYDDNIMKVIVESYGCVGVNINESKTGKLVYGQGRIEFVKLELTQNGIIDFINMRSVHSNNVDALVRDVFSLESIDEKGKILMFEAMFGIEESKRLMDLSIINGGMKDEPIVKRDVDIYYNRNTQLSRLLGYSGDETKRFLEYANDYIKRTTNDNFNISHTALLAWLDNDEIEDIVSKMNICDDDTVLENAIMLKILNMTKLGLTGNKSIKHLTDLIGHKPSDLKYEWSKRMDDETKDTYKSDLWDSVMNYESFASQRRMKDEFKKRNISVMVPLMKGLFEGIEDIVLPDCIFYNRLSVSNLEEYDRLSVHYKFTKNMDTLNRIMGNNGRVYRIECFGKSYWYIEFVMGNKSLRRRLYTVDYKSKYQMLSKEEFYYIIDGKVKGESWTYENMLISWKYSENIPWYKVNYTLNESLI